MYHSTISWSECDFPSLCLFTPLLITAHGCVFRCGTVQDVLRFCLKCSVNFVIKSLGGELFEDFASKMLFLML